MVMNHTHAKGQGQRSVGSKYRVETDGRTDKRRRSHYQPVLTRPVKISLGAVEGARPVTEVCLLVPFKTVPHVDDFRDLADRNWGGGHLLDHSL